MIEHVPKEEKLQYFEEPCIQNIQAKHHRDSDIESFPEVICPNHHCLDSAVEADAVISPPEKPSMSNKEAAAPDLLINPVEPSRMVLTFSEDEPEGNKEEMQGESPPDLVHEENISEQQEGLSTQQVQISLQLWSHAAALYITFNHYHLAESRSCISLTFKQEELDLYPNVCQYFYYTGFIISFDYQLNDVQRTRNKLVLARMPTS